MSVWRGTQLTGTRARNARTEVMRNLKIVPENCSAAENSTKLPFTGKFSSSRSSPLPGLRDLTPQGLPTLLNHSICSDNRQIELNSPRC